MMPGINGYQVANVLKANPATAHIPIVMVSALTDSPARAAGLDAGAEAFLTKPVESFLNRIHARPAYQAEPKRGGEYDFAERRSLRWRVTRAAILSRVGSNCKRRICDGHQKTGFWASLKSV